MQPVRGCPDWEGYQSEIRIASVRIDKAVEEARESLYTDDLILMKLHADYIKIARESLADLEERFERHKEQHGKWSRSDKKET